MLAAQDTVRPILVFANDGAFIYAGGMYCGSYKNHIDRYDVRDGSISSFTGKVKNVGDARALEKTDEAIAVYQDLSFLKWNLQTGQFKDQTSNWLTAAEWNASYAFSSTGETLAVSDRYDVSVFDREGRKINRSLSQKADKIFFSSDNRQLFIGDRHNDDYLVVDFEEDIDLIHRRKNGALFTLKETDTINISEENLKRYHFKQLPSNRKDSLAIAYGKILNNTLALLRNSKLSVKDRSYISIQSACGQKVKLIALDELNSFAIRDDLYFRSSRDALKQIFLRKGDQIFSAESFDIKFNRPDLILTALCNPDTALIRSYKRAYLKRLKKLGINSKSEKFSYNVPQMEIKNRTLIDYKQTNPRLKLSFKAADKLFSLAKLNIWINNVPIYGQRGIDLSINRRKTIDTTLTVDLADGVNKISFSVTNSTGIESFKLPLTVDYVPKSVRHAKLYFIGIGIDQFLQKEYNLNWSVKDIRDQVQHFKKQFANNIEIDTLFNEKVTVANMMNLKRKLLQSNVNDKVIIAYSGHGLLTKNFEYFLSTYSVDFNNPAKNGLSYQILENLLDRIPARKKLLLIDACHSGELDKEEFAKLAATDEARKKLGVTAGSRGIKVMNNNTSKVLSSSDQSELMAELFSDLSYGLGATIISAAGATEFAMENGALKNGVFTYCLLEALKNYEEVKSIGDVKKYVSKKVFELTNGAQKPTARQENLAFDWSL